MQSQSPAAVEPQADQALTDSGEHVVTAYKGFNKDMQCRDFQYEMGATYEHKGCVEACASGFHACEYPLDVFGYYAPADSRFALVEMSGELSRENSDSKIAAARISIKAELKIPEIISRAVSYILSRVESSKTESNTGYQSAATNTGNRSAATNTGNRSAATNTGYQSAATNTGDQSAATNTGDQSAATNTGNRSAATNTGYQSAASVEGKHAVAAATGIEGRAKASAGSAMVLCYRDKDGDGDDYGRIRHIRAAIAGRDGVKPDTWYSLDAAGNFVEVE